LAAGLTLLGAPGHAPELRSHSFLPLPYAIRHGTWSARNRAAATSSCWCVRCWCASSGCPWSFRSVSRRLSVGVSPNGRFWSSAPWSIFCTCAACCMAMRYQNWPRSTLWRPAAGHSWVS